MARGAAVSRQRRNGLETDTLGGGDVSIRPQDNATILAAFAQGQIDAVAMLAGLSTAVGAYQVGEGLADLGKGKVD